MIWLLIACALIIDVQKDTLVPVEDSRHFYDALASLRGPDCLLRDVYVELDGAHHAFNYLLSPRTLCLGMAALDFLDQVAKVEVDAIVSRL
jgi:hypothetical protein